MRAHAPTLGGALQIPIMRKELGKLKVEKHLEYAKADEPKMLEMWGKYLEKAVKTPEKYPKYIVSPYGFA